MGCDEFQRCHLVTKGRDAKDAYFAAQALYAERVEALKSTGHTLQPSAIAEGITDISAPIMRGERAAAALAIPFLEPKREWMSIPEIISMLLAATTDISNEMVVGDSRA